MPDGFSRWEKSLCYMKAPDGQKFWNAIEYHEIVVHKNIVSDMYLSDAEGNKVVFEMLMTESKTASVLETENPLLTFPALIFATSRRSEGWSAV